MSICSGEVCSAASIRRYQQPRATPLDMGSASGLSILAPIARLRLCPNNMTPVPPDFKQLWGSSKIGDREACGKQKMF